MIDYDDPRMITEQDVLEKLRELLRTAAAADIPIVVGTEPDLRGGPYDFRIYVPPPIELAHPASPAGRTANTRGITAASDEAADQVRYEANQLGVRVLSGDFGGGPD